MAVTYKPAERNLVGVQWEAIRRVVDGEYNKLHDTLSAAYYEKRPFVWGGRDYGVLSKATFDELHGLIEHLRLTAWHAEAQKLPQTERKRFEEQQDTVRSRDGAVVASRLQAAAEAIATARAKGITLNVRADSPETERER